jgi:hypothetical protein
MSGAGVLARHGFEPGEPFLQGAALLLVRVPHAQCTGAISMNADGAIGDSWRGPTAAMSSEIRPTLALAR